MQASGERMIETVYPNPNFPNPTLSSHPSWPVYRFYVDRIDSEKNPKCQTMGLGCHLTMLSFPQGKNERRIN